MPRILRSHARLSDSAIGWIAAALALVAAIILDKGDAPHRWHAAIMWTLCAFGSVIILSRRKWGSRRFWVPFTVCLALHVVAMWVIFARIFASLTVLGTLYAIPLAFVEAIFLSGIISVMERKLGSNKG
jgi:hypothetical protein